MAETSKIQNFKIANKHEILSLVYILLIAFFVLLSPLALKAISAKTIQVLPYEGQPYFHELMANLVFEDTSNIKSLFEGRTLIVNPYHTLLFYSSKIFGFKLISIFSPIFLGIASLSLFYIILRKFAVKYSVRIMALLAIILSPPFIYFFTVSSPDSLAIFLTLLGILLFLSEGLISYSLSLIVLLSAASFSLFNALIIIFFLVSYAFSREEGKFKFLIPFILTAGFVLKYRPSFYISFLKIPLEINSYVSDFGGIIGISSFFLILFLIGLIFSWKEKNYYRIIYLALAILILLTIKYPGLIIYTLFISSIFVGEAVSSIRKFNWRFEYIKKMAILIIICGLLFSAVAYSTVLKEASPSTELIKSLYFLQEYSQPSQKILSHFKYGFFIESFSKRPVMLDEAEFSFQFFNEKLSDANEIFMSRNPDKTLELLQKNQISFILVTKEMKNGLVWDSSDEGLLFLLGHSGMFYNIYSTPEVEIWKLLESQ